MSIIVEDGTGVANANSYISEADLTTFATARGVTLTTSTETLLIKAMDYIEAFSFKGIKKERDQALQWPRLEVYIDGYYWDSDEIPQELKDALCHTAIAIDQSNDPLQDMPRQTVAEKVGEIEVHYSPGSSSVARNIRILNAIRKLLRGGGTRVSKG